MSNSAIEIPAPPDVEQGHLDTYRNKIINGQFGIWQRGTSFVVTMGSAGIYTADRWLMGGQSDGGIFLANGDRVAFALGQTVVPGDPVYYYDFSGSVTGGGGNEDVVLLQRIEDVRTFSGETVTLSFYAKGSIAGTIRLNFRQAFGAGGSSDVLFEDIAVPLTTAWQKFVYEVAVPSIAGKTIVVTPQNTSLALRFFVMAGATNTDAAVTPFVYGGTVSLANVQLEKEAVESVFEVRPQEVEWGLCQRYYAQSYDEGVPAGSGSPGSPVIAGQIVFESDGGSGTTGRTHFPVQMRITPSVSLWSTRGVLNQAVHVSGIVANIALSTPVAPHVFGTGHTGGVNNFTYAYHYTADAEL